MTLIKDIVRVLEEWAPLKFQENYDNAGLIVGDCDIVSYDVIDFIRSFYNTVINK